MAKPFYQKSEILRTIKVLYLGSLNWNWPIRVNQTEIDPSEMDISFKMNQEIKAVERSTFHYKSLNLNCNKRVDSLWIEVFGLIFRLLKLLIKGLRFSKRDFQSSWNLKAKKSSNDAKMLIWWLVELKASKERRVQKKSSERRSAKQKEPNQRQIRGLRTRSSNRKIFHSVCSKLWIKNIENIEINLLWIHLFRMRKQIEFVIYFAFDLHLVYTLFAFWLHFGCVRFSRDGLWFVWLS